jgi:hypothetical protein
MAIATWMQYRRNQDTKCKVLTLDNSLPDWRSKASVCYIGEIKMSLYNIRAVKYDIEMNVIKFDFMY